MGFDTAILAAVVLALLLDAAIGDPHWLWRRFPHPVVVFGRTIERVERALNHGPTQSARGVVALIILLAVFVTPAIVLQAIIFFLLPTVAAVVVVAALGSVLLAHRSLHEHVRAVADAPTLEEARTALSMIVGRDTSTLNEEAVAGAALETLAESLSDGIVAPAFWFALLGLPGLVAYKVVNTADSMIGHHTDRYAKFGWASARFDDLINLLPARFTARIVATAAPTVPFSTVAHDARKHISPNAGWPEAAFAYALGVALGGPRDYGTHRVDGAWLNPEGRPAKRSDIPVGLALSTRTGILQVAIYICATGAFAILSN